MEKLFHLKERGTTVKNEIIAGITTFMTMAYILAVNPGILSACGMEFGKVFAATAISSALATLVMGLVANLPFALSAGMGINAFFSYTVCLGMGYSWKMALTAVFCEGLIFIVLTIFNIREAIVSSIPSNLRKAISASIGLLIAYIGLQNAGIIVPNSTTVSALNPRWFAGTGGLAMLGLLIISVLMIKKVKSAVLLGIILTTLIGIPMGVTKYAGGSYLPAAPYFMEFSFGEIFSSSKSVFDFIVILFIFLFVDLFDTVGTLIGCAGKSDLIRPDGSIPNCKEALLADAIGTTAGAMLGTSTVTTFVESATGVAVGGRTGLTAVTTSILFLLSLFLAPLFGSIPSAATAPALIIVGALMVTSIKELDFSDYTEGIPAFLTIIFMVCAYSISDGIMFGIISYVLLKSLSGHFREVNKTSWILVGLFVLKIVFNAISA